MIPSLHAGGMERVMSELAGYFAAKSSVELHLVLYGIKREIFYTLPHNITIHKPAFEFRNTVRVFSTIKTLFFLRRKIQALKPDTVLSFGEYWNSFVLLSVLGLNYPVYISDRCQPDKHIGRLQEFLRKWLYPKAAGIIAQTNTAKVVYNKKRLNKNITVIGNPIRAINTSEHSPRENIVLTVGRLIQSKHHDELIKLFLKINMPGWQLIIVGDNALKQQNMQRLKQMVQAMNATDKVILAGKQSDVDSYYRRSKIFAFTSSSEGFPNVIGEAQSAGLPVVAFDCVAGPADMIEDGENGYLVPLFDYPSFQAKLLLLMENEMKRGYMGKAAKDSIKKFSVNNIGELVYHFITGSRA